MTSFPLQVRVVADAGTRSTRQLLVSGELDLQTAPYLEELTLGAVRAGCQRVIIDLAGVTFIDATGVGILLRAVDQARSDDVRIILRQPSGPIRRIATLLSLQEELFCLGASCEAESTARRSEAVMSPSSESGKEARPGDGVIDGTEDDGRVIR